jgi:hypothetical protein
MKDFIKMLLPIFSNLLSGVEKISNSMENIEYALPALDLIDEILEMMNSYKMHLYEPVVDELK